MCYTLPVKERIYQLRFDGPPLDVTPKDFGGLGWGPELPQARFVREVRGVHTLASPALAAAYFLERVFAPFEAFDQEELWALLLNTRMRVTHEVMVYRGTLNAISVRPVELFREAIRWNAAGLVLGHIHPSGDPTPSPEDIAVTRHAHHIAKLLELTLADHIIVGKDAWVSLRERGLGFES